MELRGKNCIVTGSGRGIGRAIALSLARDGAFVVVNGRKREDEAKETLRLVRDAGGDGTLVMADVSTRDGCRKVVDAVPGILRVLVNNAGLGLYSPFRDLKDEAIVRQVNVNFLSALYCTQEALAKMREGVVVNLSSITGLMPSPGLSVYGAMKAALISLTKTLAVELAPIRVNAVAPGVVSTKMGESLLDILGEGWERRNTLTGRVVDPEEVADAVKFLIRNDSITGEVLTLDGGTTLVGRLTRGERP